MAEYYQTEDGTWHEIPDAIVAQGREAVGAFCAAIDAAPPAAVPAALPAPDAPDALLPDPLSEDLD